MGKVKTRLARTRGDEFALGLHRAMLADTLALARSVSVSTQVFLTPHPFSSVEFRDVATQDQGEGDLWTRLLRADALLRSEGFERVVFIGSDAPDLPPSFLRAAFSSLEHSSLAVGPSLDGGFYTLASARALPVELFENVPISSRDTCARLMDNIEHKGKKAHVLEAWRDVDDEDDLRIFIERLRQNSTAAPRCRAFLAARGLL